MAKIRNLIIPVESDAHAEKVQADLKFIGRESVYDSERHIVIQLALPTSYKKKREREAREASKREAVEESYEQRYN